MIVYVLQNAYFYEYLINAHAEEVTKRRYQTRNVIIRTSKRQTNEAKLTLEAKHRGIKLYN